MIVVVAGGGPLRADVGTFWSARPRIVIAADSGVDVALDAGITPDLVIGDMDSISERGLAWATAGDVDIHRFPQDKDRTDLELALEHAVEMAEAGEEIVVAEGGGGRLDHLLANVAVVCGPIAAEHPVRAVVGDAVVTPIRRQAELAGAVGSLVSLLAIGGPVTGITTHGLRWSLEGDTLEPGSARGVSNEFIAPTATVAVASGVLAAIQPGSLRGS